MTDGIIIQHQTHHWSVYDRVVIVATDGKGRLMGTVQVELYPCVQKSFGGSAYLHSLWVGERYRKEKVATRLLQVAEEIAARERHQTLALEWSISEAPEWVCQWYTRLGYEEKKFTPGKCALIIKELKEKQQ